MLREINSIADVKVGDIIQSKTNWHQSGKVVTIDSYHISYKSIMNNNINKIHIDNITKYGINCK